MSLHNRLYTAFFKRRLSRIEHFIHNPVEVQEKCFLSLIDTAKNTEWGRKYDYQSINSQKEFSQRVPVSGYDELKPYFQRIMHGEENVLWPGKIEWFSKSSGTTSDKSKFIPISKESLKECHYKAGIDTLTLYCSNNPQTRLFTGKSLGMGGSHEHFSEYPKVQVGDLSAILMQNLPFWAEFKRTPRLSVALMSEWENKIEIMAKETAKENVTSIAGVPSWSLILLKKILEITGKSNINEVWPNLELFIHGGVSFIPYRKQFEDIIPSAKMNYIEAYNASEGFFSIQDRLKADDMLLMLDYGIYYEFMPLEELGKEFPRTLTLADVQTNVNYAIIITTNAGLWRYLIGDTIRFTSLNPFRIQVSGRTKSFINAFGEELIVENAEKAIEAACRETNAIVHEYTAAPVFFSEKSNGAHEWIIEFEKEPDDFDKFCRLLDENLKALNSDYEAKRYKNMALQMPIIHKAETGTFYNWMKQRGKLGGQNKVPRLANERRYVEELLKMISE